MNDLTTLKWRRGEGERSERERGEIKGERGTEREAQKREIEIERRVRERDTARGKYRDMEGEIDR